MKITAAMIQRVAVLMNAISSLHEGDLRAVLQFDLFTPMKEFGPNDKFILGEDGESIVHLHGLPPPPRSLKHRAATGRELARIVEQGLLEVLAFGETMLPSYQKPRRKKEFGGRGFV